MTKLVYESGEDFFLKEGDFVDLDFHCSGKLEAAEVVALKSTKGKKVLVDVDVTIDYGPISKTKVRIHGIDSMLCLKRTSEFMNEGTQSFHPSDFPTIVK